MIRALKEFNIAGVINNIPFLLEVYINKNFIDGNFDIDFIEKEELIKKFQKNGSSNYKNLDEVAAAFTAILMQHSHPHKANGKSGKDSNKWADLKYE
jgi:pyruvate carboxylase